MRLLNLMMGENHVAALGEVATDAIAVQTIGKLHRPDHRLTQLPEGNLRKGTGKLITAVRALLRAQHPGGGKILQHLGQHREGNPKGCAQILADTTCSGGCRSMCCSAISAYSTLRLIFTIPARSKYDFSGRISEYTSGLHPGQGNAHGEHGGTVADRRVSERVRRRRCARPHSTGYERPCALLTATW